jgi:hypothetical protein
MTAHQVQLLVFKTGKFSHTEQQHGLLCSGPFEGQGPISLRHSIPFSPISFVLILKPVKLIHIRLELVS